MAGSFEATPGFASGVDDAQHHGMSLPTKAVHRSGGRGGTQSACRRVSALPGPAGGE